MKHPENFWFAMAMIGGLMLNAFVIQYIYGISNRKKR